MTPVHDARLIPAAGAAWAAAVTVTWIGTPWVAIAAGAWAAWMAAAATAVFVKRIRRAPLSRATAAVACLGVAAAAASSAAFAAEQWQRAGTDGGLAHVIAAGEVDLQAQVRERGREYASARGSACMVPVTLTAWAPQSGPPGTVQAASTASAVPEGGADRGDLAWRPLRAPATVSIAECPEAGAALVLSADLDAGDDGAIAWDAEIVSSRAADGVVPAARRAFVEASAHVPLESRGLLRGMITGDTSTMSEAQVADMRVAGLAHVTAVSGAHFAMVTLGVMAVVRTARWPRWCQAVALAAVVLAFASFVGPHPSVVRATGLAVIVAAAVAWGRRARALPSLAVTVVVVAHAAPAVAGEIGFAMSVTAVVAIVLAAPAIARRLSRVMTPRLASALSIPVAAQLALVPFLVFLQPGVGPYAVIANLAAAPFLAPVMAFGLASVVVAPWWQWAGEALAQLAGVPAWAMARICAAVADLPGAWLPWPAGITGVLVAIGAGGAGLVALAGTRALVRSVAAIVAILLCGSVWGAGTGLTRAAATDWDVVACDVGQGDMMLVRTGERSAVVVDTGPVDEPAIACLDRYRITTVPLLILTHPDLDHDGAAVAIAAHVDVERAWIARAGEGGEASRGLSAAGVPLAVPPDGAVEHVGPVTVEVLPGSQDGKPAPEGDNDASITMIVQGAQTSVLALGDLEPAGQRRLVSHLTRTGPSLIAVDVVKVAHHGSRHQDPQLAAAVEASWAVFSAGRDNDYGHPAADAVAMYTASGAAPLVTAECGDIAFEASGPATGRECHIDVAR